MTANGIYFSISQIQYTLVTPEKAIQQYNEFFDIAFTSLREMPVDLLQLEHAGNYFEVGYQTAIKRGINLFMIPSDLFTDDDEKNYTIFDAYSGMFNRDLIKVFIIDKSITNHPQIARLIDRCRFGYYLFAGEPKKEDAECYNLAKCFSNSHELIELISKDLPEINKVIKETYSWEIKPFNFSFHPNAATLNPYYPTDYARKSYFLLNQLLGNFWGSDRPEDQKGDARALINQRVSIQLSQATSIDRLHLEVRQHQPVTPIEPLMPPMVIIAPYHFPRLHKQRDTALMTKKQKMWLRVDRIEQLEDYTYGIDPDVAKVLSPEEIAQVLVLVTRRLIRLDNLGYLHALFHGSPIFRMRLIGSSINADLSHLQRTFPNKKSVVEKIAKVGKRLAELLVPEQLQSLLVKRNSQLVFITDLPMEWLRVGNYPLCLTHDVCRIPEFNVNSLMNNYVHNKRLNFVIRPDIVKRTLIIHCASESDMNMHHYFKIYHGMQATLGFTSIICSSVKEISQAVKDHQPDLLIFDCHGDFDEGDLSSFLIIDDKNDVLLTGEDIIKHQIGAPLVFISACSTMPNYGYVKFLSDAFFQAGAFAVTATFLPIQMKDAAALVIRMLYQLQFQDDKAIFSNWLAFISHMLRSTLIFETVRKEKDRNHLSTEIEDEKVAEFLLQLMVFEQRETAFENLKAYLKTINPAIDTLFDGLEHEWLSYTTVGRADLIYFEQWVEKHQQANYGSVVSPVTPDGIPNISA